MTWALGPWASGPWANSPTAAAGGFKGAWAAFKQQFLGGSMYPRNAASPPRIAVGPVVQISDGAVQTSGCTVRVLEQGGAEGDGAGTTAYSTDGVVLYTPTQGETDQSQFILIAKKTGCIPACITVPTTASAVAGYAGLDWSVINAPTTAQALTGTTIATTQKVDIETIKTNPVVNAGTITFPTTATLASTTNITAGTITTATNLTNLPAITANWLTAAGIAAGALDGKGNWNIGKTGYSLTATTGLGNQTADITGTITTATNVTTVNGLAANVITAASMAADAATEIADALLNRDMSAVSDTTARSPLNALRFIRNKWDVAAGTLTVKKEDDATTAWTATVSTNASAEPVIGSDPT